MPFPARNGHRKTAELQLIQSDNHLYAYEMTDKLRLKMTEPYITCFLVLLSLKFTLKKKLVIRGSFYNQQNAGFRTVILVFTRFIL